MYLAYLRDPRRQQDRGSLPHAGSSCRRERASAYASRTAPLSGSFKTSFRPTASASPKSGIPFPLIFSFPSVSLTGFDYP
jgi:hypothetical protein